MDLSDDNTASIPVCAVYALMASLSGSTFEVALVVPVVMAADILTFVVFLPYKSKATVITPAFPATSLATASNFNWVDATASTPCSSKL